jgi:hypothetical protein
VDSFSCHDIVDWQLLDCSSTRCRDPDGDGHRSR